MKKRLMTSAAAATMGLFVAANAHAADLYTPPPVVEPMPEPAFSWTGFYLGGHIGWGWARQDATIDEDIAVNEVSQFPGAVKLRGNGVLGGVQAGYNWQVSPNWLVGAEIDWTATDLKDTETFPNLFSDGEPAGLGFIEWKRNTKWLASLRARLGWTWDRMLLYATGGVAFNRSKYSGFDVFDGGCPGCVEDSFSKTKVGFVLGGGLEYAIASNWSLRAEYLYYRFGDVKSGIAEFDSGEPGARFLFDDLNIHTVRAGVNWLF